MADPFKPKKAKTFWQKPEGVTGALFLFGLIAGGGFLLLSNIGALTALLGSVISMSITLVVLAAIIYMVLDPKIRGMVGYMYKSVMRSITGLFVTIDPIGILKNYVDDLSDKLKQMSKQIGGLRGQMRSMKTTMEDNAKEITNNLQLASVAQKQGKQQQVILSTRKAARLKESNAKYQKLHSKMEVMHRILTKMYQNSEILLEDTKDQVQLKEQEYKAMSASHSAMKSAMSVISGDPDKRAMFDQALEHIADDVASKVGEMEQFMDMSSSVMGSIDLQNGVFEEQGMKMLEAMEKQSSALLEEGTLDLNTPVATPEKRTTSGGSDNKYDNLFG